MKSIFLLAILIMVAISVPVSAVIPIATNGKAQARVIGPKKPQPVLTQAIDDLGSYLSKVTGADFTKTTGRTEIRVLSTVPKDAPAALKTAREGYWISARGNRIRIVGGSAIGAAYGIYHFLEKYAGVRWFLPAPDGEYVPSNRNLSIPEGTEFAKPAFPMRWVGNGIWGLRNGSNRLEVGTVTGKDGKEVPAGFCLEPGIYHTQRIYLPAEEYFEKHPEYYALVKGKRNNPGKNIKLCTSNPDVVNEVARNMGRYLDEHPEIDVISLSPTDGGGFCTCEKCKALDEPGVPYPQSNSRRMVIFYNGVAEELRKSHPSVKMAVGAYASYGLPPKDESLKLQPNMCVVLCHWGPACLAHPVNDPNCPANREYSATLRDWLKRSSGVFFYEYYWKNNWYGLPWPLTHTIAKDIPWFKSIGVQGVYSQYTEGNAYSIGLNYYIAAKLLWDPKADVNELLNDYYAKYFAESAGPMRDYYTMLENRMEATKADVPGEGIAIGPKVYDPPFMDQLGEKLDEADRLAKTDVVKERIARLRKHTDYSERLLKGIALRETENLASSRKAINDIVEDYRKDPAQWSNILSPTDVDDFLDRGVNGRRTPAQAPKKLTEFEYTIRGCHSDGVERLKNLTIECLAASRQVRRPARQ